MCAAVTPGSEVEVEWQLDALDLRPVDRWLRARFCDETEEDGAARPAAGASAAPTPAGLRVKSLPAKRLVDTYLDTGDWRVVRSGFVLRTRRRGGVLEATMKDLAPAADGLRERMEVTEAIHGSGIDGLAADGPVGRRLRALVGSRSLREVLEVRTRRRLFSLVVHEEAIGEVALDDTTIVLLDDPHRLRLQRVEVEVLGSWVDALQPFVEQLRRDCGLQPATLSKFEAGLMAAGVTIPGRSHAVPQAVGTDSTLGELAYAMLDRDATAVIHYEPGTRLGDDPEALHQMRVSTRRLRAALALFDQALPARAPRLSAELGWLAAVLGAVRDLDVQLENLDQWCEELPGEHGQALDHLRDVLLGHRDEARHHLLEALDSRRYERLMAGLRSMLDQGPPKRSPQAATPAVVALPALIGQRHRAAVRAAKRAERSGVITDFHRLRLRCKRLRYAVEFTAGLYGNDAKRFGKTVAGLQDQLGLIQDAEVAYERLRNISVTSEGAALPPETIFAMGMVSQLCREGAVRRLKVLSRPAEVLHQKEWHRLSDAMTEHASAAERLARVAAERPPLDHVPRVRRAPAAGTPMDGVDRRRRRRPAAAPAGTGDAPVSLSSPAAPGEQPSGQAQRSPAPSVA